VQQDAFSVSLSPLYSLLKAAALKAGVDLPERSAFHIFRHTYATWMRREAGLDTKGLVATGAWKDRKSADRYEHVVVSEEARKAALLPTRERMKMKSNS
jgi:integrase